MYETGTSPTSQKSALFLTEACGRLNARTAVRSTAHLPVMAPNTHTSLSLSDVLPSPSAHPEPFTPSADLSIRQESGVKLLLSG